MKSGFDINRITGDGYLVVPLSMGKLARGFDQSPEQCLDMIEYFGKKLVSNSSDVLFLYTTGLYLNTFDVAHEKRMGLNRKAAQHASELRNLIRKMDHLIPSAIHFLPIDYVILNSKYLQFFSVLKTHLTEDPAFKDALMNDSGEREYTEAQENFLLEEAVVSHIIRQHLVDFPRTLVKKDEWRLIVYPGDIIETDKYVWQNSLLPKNNRNPFGSGIYDYNKKQFVNLED